jgi:hypothetical protein
MCMHRLSSVAALSVLLTAPCLGQSPELGRVTSATDIACLGHQHFVGWGWAAAGRWNGQAGGGYLRREMRVLPWRERRR